tara:strand:- start:65 stop:466 length:402 start_codon:yes stop_codon:yes gene_type:complete
MTTPPVPSEPDQKFVGYVLLRILLWVAPQFLILGPIFYFPLSDDPTFFLLWSDPSQSPGLYLIGLIGLIVIVGFGVWDSTLSLNRKYGKENVTGNMVVLKTVLFFFIQLAISVAIGMTVLAVLFVGCLAELEN